MKTIYDYSYEERITPEHEGESLGLDEAFIGSRAWKDYLSGILIAKRWNTETRTFEYPKEYV